MQTKAKCLGDREVTVTHGETRDGPHDLYGTDLSDVDGFWDVGGSAQEGEHFIIKVAKRRVGKTLCLAGRISGTI